MEILIDLLKMVRKGGGNSGLKMIFFLYMIVSLRLIKKI